MKNKNLITVFVITAFMISALFVASGSSATVNPTTFLLRVNGVPTYAGHMHFSPSAEGYPAPPPVGPDVAHCTDAPFTVGSILDLTIGGSLVIPKGYLEYDGLVSFNLNRHTLGITANIEDTVRIYTSLVHTPETLWATITGRAVVAYTYGDTSDRQDEGNYVAHGSGALEGSMIKGDSGSYSAPGDAYKSRDGTITNWPSGITAWPPT